MSLYYFKSISGEHSENAQEMRLSEAVSHAKSAAEYVGEGIKIYNANTGKLIKTIKPKTHNPSLPSGKWVKVHSIKLLKSGAVQIRKLASKVSNPKGIQKGISKNVWVIKTEDSNWITTRVSTLARAKTIAKKLAKDTGYGQVIENTKTGKSYYIEAR